MMIFVKPATAQFNPAEGCVTNLSGECLPNTILSALPFLRITPDARSGAMGDVGIGLSPDANAMHFNASKLAFVDQEVGLSATYTPWLRDLGLTDVYLTYLSGFRQIDELSTVGFALRFFSLGDIDFTDENGDPQGSGKPREIEFGVSYARKLGENFSAGLSGKYIYSNLASGQRVGGLDISSANAFAVDLSLFYKKPITVSSYDSELTFGLALSNLGSRVTYTESAARDYLPSNLGLGSALTMEFDQYNKMTFALDINKLLIPTPVSSCIIDPDTGICEPNPLFDANANGIADYREQATFSALTGSFSDAQGGFSEELQELSFSFGVEYWYDQQFAVRTGYYYEHALKGDRQFLTVGLGLKYNVFGLDLSYLVPTNNQRNPLDNTLRFTLTFDFQEQGT
jgi:hypothetical protein